MKSSATAALMSVVIPGSGQIYAGKVGKGIVVFSLFAGEAIGGVSLVASQIFCGPPGGFLSSGHSCDNSITGLGIAALAASLVTWGYSIGSAPGDAREYNERHRKHTLPIQPIIQLGRADKFDHSPNMFGLRVELPTGEGKLASDFAPRQVLESRPEH
jgi:hypothetical protein